VDQLGLFGFLGQKQYGILKQLEVRLGESTWFYCLWTRQNLPSLDQISGKNFSAIFLTILTFLYAAFILRSFPMVALEKDGGCRSSIFINRFVTLIARKKAICLFMAQ
jgi:hypothetical protein